jgi:hypothetical protein
MQSQRLSLICLKKRAAESLCFFHLADMRRRCKGKKIPPQQSERVFMWLRAASDDGFDNFIL